MDIENMSIDELKIAVYDLSMDINQRQQLMNIINQKINELTNEKSTKKTKEENKK